MANRGHVPQFGKWDAKDAQYTVVFDNARKDKGGSATKGPTATAGGAEKKPESYKSAGTNSAHPYGQFGEQDYNPSKPATKKPDMHQVNATPSSPNRSPYHQEIGPQFVIPEPRHRPKSSRPSPTPQEPERAANSRHGQHSPYQSPGPRTKAPSVPKFGEWNAGAPGAAQGYTVVFNKVKEDRQAAAAKIPVFTPEPIMDDNNMHHRYQHDPWWYKLTTCMKPHARE